MAKELPKYGEAPSRGERGLGEALGLGIIGALSSIGFIPALIIILGVLGIGIVLSIIFLPILLAGAVAVFSYYLAKAADLKGMQMFLAPLVAGVGALILFNYVDISLFSMSSPLAGGAMSAAGYSPQEASAQLFGIGEMAKLLQLLVALLVLLMVVVGILSLRMLGGKPGHIFAGFASLVLVGVVVGDWFDIGIPGLATNLSGSAGSSPMLASWGVIAVAIIVGTVVTLALAKKGVE